MTVSTVEHLGGGHACTLDLQPTTRAVEVPGGVDEASTVTVTIDKMTVTLPPR